MNPFPIKSDYSKQEGLSHIAKLFDPVGWLASINVVAKIIIIQRVWLGNIGWDDSILFAAKTSWLALVENFPQVNIHKYSALGSL